MKMIYFLYENDIIKVKLTIRTKGVTNERTFTDHE
ncbi:MAG: hypothetical protein US32_C0021G0014 [candidate division TM6 bacterium GW2011_GWA2_36_9]|nr:MAG: hypothetical protein US32_C0021G0014 [candidate division TM6 bacterium GW2011_GWA2_36_9]